MAATTDQRVKFFESALELLATGGYAQLKLAPLCASMGLTTGAFYHSFSSWREFTAQLLKHWRDERTTALLDLTRQIPDPLEQLEHLLQAGIHLPHRAEASIRVWSALDPEVAALQAEVDDERLEGIREAFRTILPEEQADAFARTGMLLLIGYEQGETTRDPQTLEWALRTVKQMAVELAAEQPQG